MRDIGQIIGHFLKLSACFSLIALGLLFLQVRQETKQTGLEARQVLAETHALVVDTRKKVDDTSSNLNAILIQAGLAADQARLASIEQREYLKLLNTNLDKTFAHANMVLIQAQTTLAQVGDTTQKVGEDVHGTSEATIVALKELVPLLAQARATLESAQKRVDDPAITSTLQQVDATMKAVTGTLQNVEKMSVNVEKRVQQLMKPASLTKRVITSFFDFAYKAKLLIF
jgi:hypothetical protein